MSVHMTYYPFNHISKVWSSKFYSIFTVSFGETSKKVAIYTLSFGEMVEKRSMFRVSFAQISEIMGMFRVSFALFFKKLGEANSKNDLFLFQKNDYPCVGVISINQLLNKINY